MRMHLDRHAETRTHTLHMQERNTGQLIVSVVEFARQEIDELWYHPVYPRFPNSDWDHKKFFICDRCDTRFRPAEGMPVNRETIVPCWCCEKEDDVRRC